MVFAFPQDVAVIAVDNDELLCRLSIPLLTSIEQGARRLGFEAYNFMWRNILTWMCYQH